jgi:hypothetical protein
LKVMRCTLYAMFFVLSLLLAACGSIIPTGTPTPLPSATATATAEPTATPTLTPTPLPPLAVLLAPPEADAALVNDWQTALNSQISEAGLRWQVRQRLNAEDLTSNLRLVIALPPDPGLADLSAAAPDTQFLAIQIPGLQAGANLTTIGSTGARPDQQGFLAGYLAAMLTPEWRVGVISVSDTLEGRSARTGFYNGVVFYCGLCNPLYAPFYDYPLYVELPASASSAEWQAIASYMVDHYVDMVYVYTGAGDQAMLDYLSQSGIQIISSGVPSEALRPNWVASLNSDVLALVQSLIPELLQGNGGRDIPLPVAITEVNPDLLSPGKLNLAGKLLLDLQAGYIDTGVDPATGEFK